jgi:hypothetical protein
METRMKTKKAGALIATISTIIIIAASLFATGMLKPSVAQPYFPNDHLFVDATYLLKTAETNDTVNVTCSPYLTNMWSKESGEIKIIAYVIETSDNLAVYKSTVAIGKIAANSTAEIEIPVVLSNNSYKVDILIFENGKLVIKGTLTINAYPIYVWDEVNHGQKQEWRLSNSESGFVQIH